ncbi:integral membrane duf6 [Pyrenophora seminiperda CCB06]|uniref:Integral membrane duf6 n=1 Tax=Pyrenophora seminiperda CCB06 TaxID=1302712 RepID=A0A3M7LUV9_9PLEO|nr:integral membrane duf6 [Pyrenophora seminiperda CCB06]
MSSEIFASSIMAQPPLSKMMEHDDGPTQQTSGHQLIAEPVLISGDKSGDTLRVNCGAIRVPSPDPSVTSIDDSNNIRRGYISVPVPFHVESHSLPSPAPTRTLKGKIQASWTVNKGLAFVLLAQLFGTLMNVATRILEVEGNHGRGYHPFQILFARMSITVICASFYMWYKKTADFPLGMKEVRSLLVARGLLGFFGVFGMYYSLLYLPLADATVITFLAPSLACWACSYFINEPFTRMEQMAAYISLFGVVLIARPVSLFAAFHNSEKPVPPASGNSDVTPANITTAVPGRLAADYDSVTATQRAMAVGIAMLGVVGAAGAYTTIRWIGKRAHPLISVNYFAAWCTVVSIVAMFTLPGVSFLLPNNLKDWCYLVFLGICGFVMQFLLAAGLQYEKSSRATNMVYMQMLFALTFDKLVWGTTPGALSIIGSSLILGSAIYVAIHKEEPKKKIEARESGDRDEESRLMLPDFDSGEREEHADISMVRLG